MDRVHYRRVTPSRSGASERGEEPTAFENIVMQCVVSGILIIFVLIISTAPFEPANALRDGLRRVLSGAETPAELLAAARSAGVGYGPSPETEPESFPQPETPHGEVHFPPHFSEEIFLPYELHFPEELPPTVEGELSNPQIPGPSVVPELWD